MAFRTLDFNHLARFNSASSSEFLDKYTEYVKADLVEQSKRMPHQTFAPSSFRCDRRSWFRLRGVTPDTNSNPDSVLEFAAQMGTACHRMIQSNLKAMLGSDWVDVMKYVYRELPNNRMYTCTHSDDGFETLVDVADKRVRFSVDGLILWKGQYTLIEIKSVEFSVWNELTEPRSEHSDQVKFYGSLLNVHKALVIYIDRQYGQLKCYEVDITSSDKSYVEQKMSYVLSCVESGIAPEPLPVGDKWCTRNMCQYYDKCQEYGRY